MLKLDALFNLLGVLIFFIFVLLAQVNPPSTPGLASPGNLITSAMWPAGNSDVDLWVSGPNDKAVGFSNKSGKTWNLLRDDRGTLNDQTSLNFESAFTRGIPDGEYVINVKCYSCAGSLPIPVTVEVRLANGTLVWVGTIDLVRNKQERTAIRFRMAGGKVVAGSESQVFKDIKRS